MSMISAACCLYQTVKAPLFVFINKNDFSQECLKNGDDTGFPSLGEEGLTGWANNQKL